MNRMIHFGSLFLLSFLLINSRAEAADQKLNGTEFELLMKMVADGWNAGDAKKAADCFTEDAIYIEPPNKQLYRGRAALFKFFGGEEGRKSEMKMTWHHLMFNESQQTGAGEFTFDYGGKVHGMVIVKLIGGKIHRWREYWYESAMDWETFIGDSKFPNE